MCQKYARMVFQRFARFIRGVIIYGVITLSNIVLKWQNLKVEMTLLIHGLQSRCYVSGYENSIYVIPLDDQVIVSEQ